MNERPLVSVIVPVYRTEEYLGRCAQSVLSQSFRDLELILVDDGSPDGCPAICDSLAACDSRVRVIHKPNGGLSDARNAGVAEASGRYTAFLDSDDFWKDPDVLGRIVSRAEETGADVLSFGFVKYYPSDGREISYFGDAPFGFVSDRDTLLERLTERNLFIACAWNKLIVTDLIRDLPFTKGMISEDVDWCARLMTRAALMDFIPVEAVCYSQREGSITHSVTVKACDDLADAALNCLSLADSSEGSLKTALLRYTGYQTAAFIAKQAMAGSVPHEAVDRMCALRKTLAYAPGKKAKIMDIGTRILGFRGWCALIRCTRSVWGRKM